MAKNKGKVKPVPIARPATQSTPSGGQYYPLASFLKGLPYRTLGFGTETIILKAGEAVPPSVLKLFDSDILGPGAVLKKSHYLEAL